jgi:hypothetical protein
MGLVLGAFFTFMSLKERKEPDGRGLEFNVNLAYSNPVGR